jgi:hypothetical protein
MDLSIQSTDRREIITVRGQSYVSRLPNKGGGGVHTRRAERGVNILASYSNNLSTIQTIVFSSMAHDRGKLIPTFSKKAAWSQMDFLLGKMERACA